MATRKVNIRGKLTSITVPDIGKLQVESSCPEGTEYNPLILDCSPVKKPNLPKNSAVFVNKKNGFVVTDSDILTLLVYKAYNNKSIFIEKLAVQNVPIDANISDVDFAQEVINLYSNPITRLQVMKAAVAVTYNPNTQNWTTTTDARKAVLDFENNYNK